MDILHNENHPRSSEVYNAVFDIEGYKDWMILGDLLILATQGYNNEPKLTVMPVDEWLKQQAEE
jgi:hypothetical protein